MELKEVLKRLSELDQTACAAPWYKVHTDDRRSMSATYVSKRSRGNRHDGQVGLDGSREDEIIALTFHQSAPAVMPEELERADANSELIALMRTHLPELLDHIERLESANRALRHEQQRLRRAPEKDWQQVSAAMSPLFAKLVELGFDELVKTGIAALDQGRTYVNRILTERDALAEQADS